MPLWMFNTGSNLRQNVKKSKLTCSPCVKIARPLFSEKSFSHVEKVGLLHQSVHTFQKGRTQTEFQPALHARNQPHFGVHVSALPHHHVGKVRILTPNLTFAVCHSRVRKK
jgi:hypothetical protein